MNNRGIDSVAKSSPHTRLKMFSDLQKTARESVSFVCTVLDSSTCNDLASIGTHDTTNANANTCITSTSRRSARAERHMERLDPASAGYKVTRHAKVFMDMTPLGFSVKHKQSGSC